MALDWRRESLTIDYGPRFSLWDMNTSAIEPTLYQTAGVRGEWREKLVRLTLGESAAYGVLNMASIPLALGPSAPPTPINVVPVSHLIAYVSSSTAFSARVELRRWTIEPIVRFDLSGGTDEESRAYAPFMYGPSGELRLDFAASHLAHLITVASVLEDSFSFGAEVAMAALEERWHQNLSRLTQLQLAAGAATTRDRGGVTLAYETNAYPIGEATLEHRPGGTGAHHFVFRASARISPMVNPLLGLIDERLQGRLELEWIHQRVGVVFSAGAQQTVPPDAINAVQLILGEARVAYEPYPSLGFDAGFRGIAQNAVQPVAGGPPFEATFLQGIVFVGVTIRAPTVRF